MKLSAQLNELFNNQILHEMKNVMIYHQIQSYFESMQLKNLSKYFADQAEHEHQHAQKFIKYVNDRTGGKVELKEIPFDGVEIDSIMSVSDLYVQTEELTTELIEEIYATAISEKSFMDLGFITEMLNEQVEEEDTANEFSLKIRMTHDLVLFDATFGE